MNIQKKEISAGGIVVRKKGRKIEVALIKTRRGRYAFPKGHLEKGERPPEAALREVREEMGCKNVKLLKFIGKTDYRFKNHYGSKKKNDSLVYKQVYFYLMRVGEKEKCHPTREEGITGIVWAEPEEALKLLSYKNLIPLLTEALRQIDDK